MGNETDDKEVICDVDAELNHIKNFSLIFSVMTFGPVIASARLSKHKVVRSKDLTKRTRPHAVHGARFQVYQDCPGHVLATTRLVVVDIDPLKLEIRCSSIGSSWVNSMLIRNYLPKL